MKHAKVLVDDLNAWHCRKPDWFALDNCIRSAAPLHFWLGASRAQGA